MAEPGEGPGGAAQSKLGTESQGGGVKPSRRRPWWRFLGLRLVVLSGVTFGRRTFLGRLSGIPVDPGFSSRLISRGQGETGQFKADRLLAGDPPFEFLTYQLDGRIVAYHGYNG